MFDLNHQIVSWLSANLNTSTQQLFSVVHKQVDPLHSHFPHDDDDDADDDVLASFWGLILHSSVFHITGPICQSNVDVLFLIFLFVC